MSNLHVNLDESNKHTPKGFDLVGNNTFPTKDENGLSTYEERMSLPKAINFVDGTLAAPSTADGDVFVLIGSGVVHPDWGSATFDDWVRFTNSTAVKISPLAGYLCFDVTANEWKEYNGADWVTFGGGGVVDTLYSADGTIGAGRVATLTDTLTFSGGTTILKGANTLGGSSALLVENSASTELLNVENDGTTTVGGKIEINGKDQSALTSNFILKDSVGTPLLDFRNNGDFALNTNMLYADSTNDVLGVQITSPDANSSLHISGLGKSTALRLDQTTGDYLQGKSGGVNKIRLVNSTSFGGNIQLYDNAGNFQNLIGGDRSYFQTKLAIGTTAAQTEKFYVSGSTYLGGDTEIDGNLGVFGTTPIAQPTTGIAAATFVANTSAIVDDTATFDGYTIGQVVKALRNLGILA